jgi:FkbM family methyltransferase
VRVLWIPVKFVLGLMPPRAYRAVRRSLLNLLGYFGITNSLHGMDKRIAALFGHKRNGVFIEVGAADGVNQSNTLYLERRLGWTGLLVEPVREQFEYCRKVRRNSIVERYVLCPFEDAGKTFNMVQSDLMSVVVDSESLPMERNENVSSRYADGRLSTEEVAARPLASILEDHGIREVDIFSLDVEDAERFVLEGVDFDACRIHYLLVETRDLDEFRAYVEERGYAFVKAWSVGDYLFEYRG